MSPMPSGDAFELQTILARLGLDHCEQSLVENGFDDWETVADITEDDLSQLGFKLGDRRKLQRAIREHKSAITSPSQDSPRSVSVPFKGLPVIGGQASASSSSNPPTRPKRTYRRHPRPDHNGPVKPKTAYVLFTEHVRTDPAISSLSFSEIAKKTGNLWRDLPPQEKAKLWDGPAAERMQEYAAELEKYKKTENYQIYQRYLADFKQAQQNLETTAMGNKSSPSFESQSGQSSTSPTRKRHHSIRQDDALGPSMLNPLHLDNASEYPSADIEPGMEEIGRILSSLGVSPLYSSLNSFPTQDLTTAAVEAFFHGTGSLLYLWDHDEALEMIQSVYHSTGDSTQAYGVELLAMSSLGCYCDSETVSPTISESFLHMLVSMLSSPLDISDLRYMRLFTCLAIYRFTNSVESARKLILSALTIGREAFTSPQSQAELSDEKARYWWNVFRSVVFLESWFAYNTGNQSRVTERDLILFHPSNSDSYPPESVHPYVAQLGRLASYIAFDLRARPDAKAGQAQTHLESLNKWHRALPPPMQLRRLSLGDLDQIEWHTKRSLLQLHMLFLGLFIEPYRIFLVDLGKSRLIDISSKPEDLATMEDIESQCVLGARQCARVASILQMDNLVRSHCWVSVYTSFTACSILLFDASQKLLILAHDEIGQDLSYASSHLNLLSLCSYNNNTTRTLYTTLQVLYNDTREIAFSPVYRVMREGQLLIRDAALVPPSSEDAVIGMREIGENILDLAKRCISLLEGPINV